MASDKENQISAWVKAHSDGLFSWALYKTSDKTIAEDLVQETFISAFEHLDRFEGKSNPKTWLQSILNNKITDHYRRQSRSIMQRPDTDAGLTDTMFDASGAWKANGLEHAWDEEVHFMDNPEFNAVLEQCMGDLPSNWRLALLSKYILNKDPKAICQELDISASNYWQIVHRAKLLLKKCLEINWLQTK
jgi:RNA polymerase sigma-70 factor (TIGR02943 family)